MKIALKDLENIRQIYRQSGFVLTHTFVLSFFALAIPVYLSFRYEVPQFVNTLLWVWAIVVVIHAIRAVIIWRLNRYVITNQRLLSYGQKGFFDQIVVETPHERILNVSYKTEGAFSTILGFGDVIVQVVGLVDPIVLKNISTPMEIKDYLWEMHKRLASNKNNNIFADTDATHIQEQVGYSKGKQ